MPFFPPEPAPDDAAGHPPEQPAWWGPHDDEVPVTWSAPTVLGASAHVAVALVGADVYTTGVSFRIERRLRRRGWSRADWARHREIFMGREDQGDAGRLRYGVVLGDGVRVLDGYPVHQPDEPLAPPDSPVLLRRSSGGGGSDHLYTLSEGVWLWPLPPAGPLDLVFQWPILGLDETHVPLDGTGLAGLSGGVVRF